jgi:diadenosine tetraphosphate (Ap4A) HIT family hydrolase
MSELTCIFCSIINKKIPATVVVENDSMIVINDLHPKAPVHYLVIPKRHIPDFLMLTDDSIMQDIRKMIQQIGIGLPNQSFRLLMNNGAAAGQSVFHLHVHMLAGKNMGGF